MINSGGVSYSERTEATYFNSPLAVDLSAAKVCSKRIEKDTSAIEKQPVGIVDASGVTALTWGKAVLSIPRRDPDLLARTVDDITGG
ncbi:hypothetical protein [Novipirellula aureliae]|uniref:hypothetical protein n=1 Tax=Novipirellula aureliae TaxID=2527966 RepID=UPI0011B84682|nr:hypothetical protein [Novipirellula aureliae]